MATNKSFFNRILRIKFLSAFFVLFSLANALHAEYFSLDQFSFTMDIPEGYELKDFNPETNSFFFETRLMPVKLALKIYSAEETKLSAKDQLADTMAQLKANYNAEEISWYKRPCALAYYSFVMPDQKEYTGWALSVQVPLAANPKEKANLIFLTYADSQIAKDCEQFMISIIDSVFFCKEDFRRPGPFTCFAYPKTKDEQIVINIADRVLSSKIDADAIDRSNFVLEREYAVLTLYAKHKSWKEAWQRFYRLIFKESYSALDALSEDMYKTLLPLAQRNNFENPEMELIQMILDWVQDFGYRRDKGGTDFTSVTASVQGVGSDCDSRSMLMCILMEHMGIKSELFVSREYSHSVFGLAVKHNGALINVDGTDYVLGETTAKVNFGLIAQEHSDTNKWIAVDLP